MDNNSNNCQKIKLLKLVEFLREEADYENPLTTHGIIYRLGELGITCNRRTITRDIETLNSFGYEIESRMVGHEKGYYLEDGDFSIPEIKILIDAVQAANFITEKKTKQMVNKLAALAGNRKAEVLKSNMVCFNTRKHSNEQILYNVSSLEDAIQRKKQVTFYYYDLNEKCEKVFRKNKELYTVEPLALIYSEDNYYLMTYNFKYDSITNYRVDRMETINVLDKSISTNAKEILTKRSPGQYTKQVFKMYGGEPHDLILHFDDSLLGPVFDKFGENIKITRVDEHHCEASVAVQVSPPFYGWVAQFGEKMKLLNDVPKGEDSV